jgi:4-azaleucine resistance transporter AzlC
MSTEVMTEERAGRSLLAEGLRQAAPIIMGYVPVGAAFGVLASKTGLSLLSTVLMSVFVYAGSAQLIAVAMFAAGLSPLAIVITTLVVNLRHVLMTAALSQYVRSWPKWQLALFAYEVTDESFALHSARFARGDRGRAVSFFINSIAHVCWVLASFVGYLSGSAIPDVKPLGLDFALPAMFIALLAMQVKNGLHVFVAGFTGLASIALMQSGADRWSVIIATIIGATVGAGVESWMKKRS